MKKWMLWLMTLCLGVSMLSGCTWPGKQSDGTLRVVTTVFPSYDFTRQIAGDHARVTMLLTPGAESHSYEPTPADVLRIQQCDLFVYIGGESEVWVEEILQSLEGKNIRTLRLFDCVAPLEEEEIEGADHGHEHEHAHEEEAEYDEHIWTAPQNALAMSKAIADSLEAADPAHADAYRQKLDAYSKELTELDADFSRTVSEGKRREIVFGDRFPFRYFAHAYGLEYYAAFSGCSSETEASPATMSFLIRQVKEDRIPLVFYTESSNHKIADRLAEATGAQTALFHSCNNVSKEELESGATYVSLMRQNLDALEHALNDELGA